MKRQIKEILFKIFRRQILRVTYNLNPKNFVQIKEVKFDWVKVTAKVQTNEPPGDLLDQLRRKTEIERQIHNQLMAEISKKIEIKKWPTNNPYSEIFVANLFIANEPKF